MYSAKFQKKYFFPVLYEAYAPVISRVSITASSIPQGASPPPQQLGMLRGGGGHAYTVDFRVVQNI